MCITTASVSVSIWEENYSDSDTKLGFNLGVGANAKLTDNFFINAELSLKNMFEVDYLVLPVKIGVSYRF